MSGTLYLVATPIGNLEDMTFRAIKVLQDVDLIAAEDTRHSLHLLHHFDIRKPLVSYHRHNEENRVEYLIEKLEKGENIAVITDAGTPGISDPGEEIVKAAIAKQISVVPIPGACAFVNALIASGLDTKEFAFYGFLPVHKKLKRKKLEEIQLENRTVIVYEAPHKLKNTLEDMYSILGDRQIVLAKELTKLHEQFWRGSIKDILEEMEEVKGEFVIMIEKSGLEKTAQTEDWDTMTLEEHYAWYTKEGMEKKEIIKKIAKDRNVAKNEIYQYFLNM